MKNKNKYKFKFNKEKITKARLRLDLTQMELANLIGVSHVTIFRWENGDRTPNVNRLADLANALGEPIEYFYNKKS